VEKAGGGGSSIIGLITIKGLIARSGVSR